MAIEARVVVVPKEAGAPRHTHAVTLPTPGPLPGSDQAVRQWYLPQPAAHDAPGPQWPGSLGARVNGRGL